MRNVYIYPYKMGSKSARALAKALNSPQIRHKKSKFVGGRNRTVINWGAASFPRSVEVSKVINRLEAVRRAGNKLSFFRLVEKSCRTVPWTTSRDEALKWLKEKATVVARNTLTGHSGSGIMIVTSEEVSKLPNAPLYTKYIPKDSEWRVHVMRGNVVDVQRKVRNPDQKPKDWKVRSHDNGFIFIRHTESPPKDVLDQAVRAFNSSGLDFGAVDVIFNQKRGEAYVLEINCAPGLEGQTIQTYANAFRKYLAA